MIDNTLGQNDMTGMPGPDMAAAGAQPTELNPANGTTVPGSAPIKTLAPVSPGSAIIGGTEAKSQIQDSMKSYNNLDAQKKAAIDAALAATESYNQTS
jgi:hypothetical protein